MRPSSNFKLENGISTRPTWDATASCLLLYILQYESKMQPTIPSFYSLAPPPTTKDQIRLNHYLFGSLKASLPMTRSSKPCQSLQLTFLLPKRAYHSIPYLCYVTELPKKCPEKDYPFSKSSQIFSKFQSSLPK